MLKTQIAKNNQFSRGILFGVHRTMARSRLAPFAILGSATAAQLLNYRI
jgi:hypothetical protein